LVRPQSRETSDHREANGARTSNKKSKMISHTSLGTHQGLQGGTTTSSALGILRSRQQA